MSKRILITGASGFLGSNLALGCLSKGHRVWGSYHSQPFKLEGIDARKLDVSIPRAIEDLVSEVKPDFVFHAAAMANPDLCARDMPSTRQINVQGSKLVAEACAKHGAKLVFTSTDLVFDGSVHWVTEKDEARPLGVYGRSKLDAEAAVLGIEGARAAVLRTSIMYGWGRASGRSFAEIWLKSLLINQPVMAFTDQYRCPVWVEDLCSALVSAAESDLHGVFHAAGPERMNRHDFARRLAKEFSLDSGLVKAASMNDMAFEDPRPKEASLKIDKLAAAIGYAPLGVDEGLKRMHERLHTLR